MPAHKSAIKRIRQAQKNRLRNVSAKSALKSVRKEFLELLASHKGEAEKKIPQLQATIDKAAKRGIIHRKKANRWKSRILHQFHQTAAGASA